ncbi:hypothetical protein OG946_20265 [Streptomyces sp. NBC_01808]|uniref:hypothetical protein n=1 Tax=Streptomyces sp. NBC_01808 TaxID=2975947 RepID=UPI002DDB76C7|nr:hypothetical protein [Streptomyces sp. NBC_01808]WSA39491.1 hypothetical protein OG946_20265 [Streptomyces sp. NBC_01808]
MRGALDLVAFVALVVIATAIPLGHVARRRAGRAPLRSASHAAAAGFAEGIRRGKHSAAAGALAALARDGCRRRHCLTCRALTEHPKGDQP